MPGQNVRHLVAAVLAIVLGCCGACCAQTYPAWSDASGWYPAETYLIPRVLPPIYPGVGRPLYPRVARPLATIYPGGRSLGSGQVLLEIPGGVIILPHPFYPLEGYPVFIGP